MRSNPITVGWLPNFQPDDLKLVWRLLAKPASWRKGTTSGRVCQEFEFLFPGFRAYDFLSGRVALSEVLRALGVKRGDEVVVPSFSCVVVANAVLNLGAKPVFADIEADSFNASLKTIKKVVTAKTKAIVVQHTFGLPVEVDHLVDWAHQKGIKVIEDCAHGLKVPYRDGWLGGFGDGAIFSFGRDKAVSSVFGGVGMVREEVAPKLKENWHRLALPTNFFVFRQLVYLIYSSFCLKTYYLFGLGKLFHWLGLKVGLLTKAVLRGERGGREPKILRARLPEGLAQLALYQLKKIDRFNHHRVRAITFYQNELKNLPLKLPKTELNQPIPLLRYTVQTEKAQDLFEFAKEKGVILNNWYYPAISPVGVNYAKIGYQPKKCPVAEKVAPTVVNLPTHPNLTREDQIKVVAVVGEFFGA